MGYIKTEVVISAEEYFDQCDESEKQDLKELVYEYFDVPFLDPNTSLIDAVIEHLDIDASGIEAEEYVRRTLEEMEYKLKMRDFS